MRFSYRTRLGLILGVGLLLRIGLAFASHGLRFDLESYALVERALKSHPLHVYALVNQPHLYRWPYLPGSFPAVLLAGAAHRLTGLAFTSLVRMPAVLADLALAWVAQDFLGRRGRSDAVRLAAAAAIAVGPLFIANSAYDGQYDSLAVLPAALALTVWQTARPGRRAVWAGLLIGIGCALKSFPLLMALALLPTCLSVREAAALLGVAIAVPVLCAVPWLVVDAHGVVNAVKYHSLAGTGGISLLVQPNLAGDWLGGPYHGLSGTSRALQGALGTVVTLAPVAFAAAISLRRRLGAAPAAGLLWLTLLAFSVNFGPRYALWGMPFWLMAGQARGVVALQLLLIAPLVLLRAGPFSDHAVVYAYVPLMLAAWLALVIAVALSAGRLLTRPAGAEQLAG